MAPGSSRFSNHQLAVPIILAIFGGTSTAQLVGCDAAGCPLDEFNRPQCVIGNLSANEIGIANFSTSISPSPLTWTLSIANLMDPTNHSQGIFTRTLYLGAPPSLDLQTSTTLQSCALFFEGISSDLAFPLHDLDTDVGTCSDALGSACVNDLMVQANSTMNDLIAGNNSTTTSICQTLQAKLRDNAPSTCTHATKGSWGTITAKEITGPSSAGPLEQGDCHPTTGKNYTISLVDSYSITEPDEITFIGNFMSGITPIMTIFFPSGLSTAAGNSLGSPLGAPEIHLTCLKTVGSLAGCVGCGSSAGSTGSTGLCSITKPAVKMEIMMATAVFALTSV